jgi:hypothetical protein
MSVGLAVATFFILRAICTPQFWRRYRTSSSLIPRLEPWPKNAGQIANELALEIAKRILLSVRQIPVIGGHFLDHLKTSPNWPKFGRHLGTAYQQQSEHGDFDSCPQSDASKTLVSSAKNKSVFDERIITLFDMNEFAAEKMVNITANIEYLEKIALCHSNSNSPKLSISWGIDKSTIENCLSSILPDLELLGLINTKAGCQRTIDGMYYLKPENLGHTCVELRHRLNDELKGRTFFQLNQNQVGLFNNTVIASEQFKANFPKGNGELIEAGNCLAFDRYTACVCHLMRALEFGLIALESSLDIIRPEKGPERTWGKTLGRIQTKFVEKEKNQTPDWMKNETFYRQVFAVITAIKGPYRDLTFHVESVYDAAGAKSVFKLTVEALRHIATELKE